MQHSQDTGLKLPEHGKLAIFWRCFTPSRTLFFYTFVSNSAGLIHIVSYKLDERNSFPSLPRRILVFDLYNLDCASKET